MQKMWVPFLSWEDPLEKEIATTHFQKWPSSHPQLRQLPAPSCSIVPGSWSFWLFLCHSIFKVVTILDVTVDIFLGSYHFFFSWQYTSFLSLNVISWQPGSRTFLSLTYPWDLQRKSVGKRDLLLNCFFLFCFFKFPPPLQKVGSCIISNLCPAANI